MMRPIRIRKDRQTTRGMKALLTLTMLSCCATLTLAQNFSSRSNTMAVDYSDDKTSITSTLPKITWTNPVNETVFLKDGKIELELQVESKTPLKAVQLILSDKNSGEVKSTGNVPLAEENKFSKNVTRNL